MIEVNKNLARQLNPIFGYNENNCTFSSEDLNSVRSICVSKKDLKYLGYFSYLADLSIDSFPSISDEDLLNLSVLTPNLKSLKIKEQNALFNLDFTNFKNLEELCIIHNDNVSNLKGISHLKRLTFYDNKDFNNVDEILNLILDNKQINLVVDIVYYLDIRRKLVESNESLDILDNVIWVESIGLRDFKTYYYSNKEMDEVIETISYYSSLYVYDNDDEMMRFTILYALFITKFNEDDSECENLYLISNVNKVFTYLRGGRLTLAEAFQMLIRFQNIKSYVVYSLGASDLIGYVGGEKIFSLLGDSDYAVLRVLLDNKYYYLDIAWDTLVNFHGLFDKLRFFLFSKDELKLKHKFVGEGNITNTYSYHGDDSDELIAKAKDRIKEVDEVIDDVERYKDMITGKEFEMAVSKIMINDFKKDLENLDIDSDEYKTKMANLIKEEENLDLISDDLLKFNNSRKDIINSYSKLLLNRYLGICGTYDRDKEISKLKERKKLGLISTYLYNLLIECMEDN